MLHLYLGNAWAFRGTLLDAETAEPLPGVELRVFLAVTEDGDTAIDPTLEVTVTTDAEGKYEDTVDGDDLRTALETSYVDEVIYERQVSTADGSLDTFTPVLVHSGRPAYPSGGTGSCQ